MKKKIVDLSPSEQGQTLVIIALVFVGLVALAGLAVDGGNSFVQRRQAQNAADAATLAGTRLVSHAIQTCASLDLLVLDAEIDRTINDYAEQNGVSDTNGVAGDEVNDNVIGYYVDKNGTSLGQVGELDTLPLNTAGVRVEVNDTDRTFFLPVVGIDELPSSAQAMALTGPIKQWPAGQPLLPIGVPKIVVEQLGNGKKWEMHDNKDGEFCYPPDDPDQVCIEDPGAPHNAQRGWLNLNHNFNDRHLASGDDLNRTFDPADNASGCPKDPNSPPQDKSDLAGLPGYASGECPYPLPIIAGTPGNLDGDSIHGSSGAKETAIRAVYEAFKNYGGAYAPVFDRAYLRDDMVDAFPDQAESPDGFPNGGGFAPAGGGSGGAYYYHIVGYVLVKGDYADKKPHIVYATFDHKVVSGGILAQGYTGAGTCTDILFGINLWE